MSKVIPAQESYAKPLCDLLIRENYFGNPGRGDRQDKTVRGAIMKLIHESIAKPPLVQGKAIEPEVVTLRGPRNVQSLSVIEKLKKIYGSMSDGGISVTFLGETHNDTNDQKRVEDYMSALKNGTLQLPTLTVFERGLTYDTASLSEGYYVRENDLTTSSNAPLGVVSPLYPGNWGFALSIDQRSMVVAGYIALSLAAELDQSKQERVMIFFGSEHADLVTKHLEYFYRHVANWIEVRKRVDLIVDSSSN